MFNHKFFDELGKLSKVDEGDIRPILNEMRETLGYFIQTFKISDEELEKQLATIINDRFEASIVRERMHKAMPHYAYTEEETRLSDDQKRVTITINYI